MEDSSLPSSTRVVEGLAVSEHVAECLEQGFSVIPEFISAAEIDAIRSSFDTEVPMTEMRAIGTDTGKTLWAHNLLAICSLMLGFGLSWKGSSGQEFR